MGCFKEVLKKKHLCHYGEKHHQSITDDLLETYAQVLIQSHNQNGFSDSEEDFST